MAPKLVLGDEIYLRPAERTAARDGIIVIAGARPWRPRVGGGFPSVWWTSLRRLI